jgi:RNA polymerase sigma-70 factor (ECF subfamily)
MDEPAALLDAARAGDADAFSTLVEPFHAQLRTHCYQMLGSLPDAEDALQETLVRAWRNMDRLDDRAHVRAWLYKIATNRCLTLLKVRARRELPVDITEGAPATEITWLDPYPDKLSPESRYLARENIELAFVAALQHLSPVQRSALLLQDVLRFSAAEVAEQLDTSTTAVNSAVARARKAIESAAPTQQTVLAELGPDGVAAIAQRWADAWERADIEAIVAMLADDARYSMPPLPQWYAGRAAIRAFLIAGPLRSRWRFLTTTANGQLAFGTYLWDDATALYVPGGLDILTIRDDHITDVISFLAADLTKFGLPAHLSP